MYNVSRSNIADIINYRTWSLKENVSIRVYKEKNKVCNLGNFESFYNKEINEVIVAINDLKVYIEKLPIDRLVYFEVHQNEKFLFNTDLYFPLIKKRGQKKDYIICNKNPHNTNRILIDNLINELFYK